MKRHFNWTQGKILPVCCHDDRCEQAETTLSHHRFTIVLHCILGHGMQLPCYSLSPADERTKNPLPPPSLSSHLPPRRRKGEADTEKRRVKVESVFRQKSQSISLDELISSFPHLRVACESSVVKRGKKRENFYPLYSVVRGASSVLLTLLVLATQEGKNKFKSTRLSVRRTSDTEMVKENMANKVCTRWRGWRKWKWRSARASHRWTLDEKWVSDL